MRTVGARAGAWASLELSQGGSPLRLSLDLAGESGHALLFRRGPSTANRLQPAADFQFSRTERLRLELPLQPDMKPGQGRLLDRSGQELKVPVTVAERTDAETGQRWLTGDVILASLGQGDYVIEVAVAAPGRDDKTQQTLKTLTAIRVTR